MYIYGAWVAISGPSEPSGLGKYIYIYIYIYGTVSMADARLRHLQRGWSNPILLKWSRSLVTPVVRQMQDGFRVWSNG